LTRPKSIRSTFNLRSAATDEDSDGARRTHSTAPAAVPEVPPMIHVLLVDDDVQFTSLVAPQLRKAKFEVTVANSAAEALSVLRYTTPHVILLDLNMPEFDGKQVLGFLQRSVEHCTIPVIVVTACEGDDCTEAIQKGAFTVLSKTGSSMKQLIDYIKHVTANDDAAAA
jgi:CheY-like chemotaxis protein